MTLVLGLTGSIGMGKSATAQMFRRLKVPVFDSDAAVHAMLGPGGAAVSAVEAAFPGVTGPQGVDRQALGARVFGDDPAKARLEAILHPRVFAEQRRFLATARARRVPLAVLDVPLLFETGGERRVDKVAVVSAPAWLQRQRVLARPGMTEAKFQAILAAQIPDAEKRRRADYIIPTGRGFRPALQAVRRIVRRARQGRL